MSLNLATALILQKHTVRIFAMGPFKNGKYGSVVYLMRENKAIDPIISIQHGEFNTCKEAIDKLNNVVDIVRGLDLPIQKKELKNISY